MPKKPERLSQEALDKARKQLADEGAAEQQALTDQILFEARRDELAYKLIQAAHAKGDRLAFGEAQKLAESELKTKKAKTAEPAPAAA